MNRHREAIEKTYTDRCNIIEYKEYKKENKSTGHKEVIVQKKRPCRLSFSSIVSTSPSSTMSTVEQKVKLFIAPEIDIKPGSKIDVTRKGITTSYSSSGKAAVYDSHQEIMLELFTGWA